MPVIAASAGDFNYTVNGGSITITGYTGPGGDVAIPDSVVGKPVTSIGPSAFVYSSGLTTMTIPDSVTSIGSGAFAYCTALTSVTIPEGVTSIGDAVFRNCGSLTDISVAAGNASYSSSLDGVLFDKSRGTLIQYPGGRFGDYIVPSGVTNIRTFAFADCRSLTGVTIQRRRLHQ
jgi:hypothetical protein